MKLSRYALYMYDYSILLLIKVHYPRSANHRHSVIVMKLLCYSRFLKSSITCFSPLIVVFFCCDIIKRLNTRAAILIL